MIEDGRPAPVTWRFNPFTESFTAVLKTDEDRIVAGSSPFYVRLFEVPRENSPSSVSCVILVQLDEPLDNVETDVDILAADYGRVLVGDVILVDTEQMLVTVKPGSPTLTVTRGYGGTGAAGHADGTMMELLASMTEITSGSPATREFRVDYDYSTGLVLFNTAEQGYDVRFDYWGLGTPLFAGDLWRQANMREYEIGDYLLPGKSDSTVNVVGVGYLKFKEIRLDRTGDLRIKFQLTTDGGGTIRATIYKNGAPVGTERNRAGAGSETFSEDIFGWATNDLVQLYCKTTGVVTSAENFRIYADEVVGAARTEDDLPIGY